MKTRDLFMGEKQAIVKLIEKEKSVRAIDKHWPLPVQPSGMSLRNKPLVDSVRCQKEVRGKQ